MARQPIAGVAVWALEVQVNLPDWIVRIAMLKLTVVASAGLLAGGAIVGRHARQRSLDAGTVERHLGDGATDRLSRPGEARTAQGVDQRRSDTPV